MLDQISQEFHRNILSVNLWENQHSGNIYERPNFSESFIKNVLSVDLWEIPQLKSIDERSNFSRAPSKCTKYRPLKNSTLRKYRWKTKLLKELHRECIKWGPLKNSTLRKYRWRTKLLKRFLKNVLSVDLWKSHTQKISMKDQTSQGFHQKCTKCKPLKNSTLREYPWKIKLLEGFLGMFWV